MTRLDILRLLSKKNNAKSYLEIGVLNGDTYLNLDIETKVGVDPWVHSAANMRMTSDEFFANNHNTFDLVFIDGLHHADQVERDINNSLSCLNDNGYIVCHDLLPYSERVQLISQQNGAWYGDCWKAWAKMRSSRSDLTMYVVDTDTGCGIIHKGNQETIKINHELNYQNFCIYKQEWMNIISIKQFSEILGYFMSNMTWLDLYNFLYQKANDIKNCGEFPWQESVEIFDFDSLNYYPIDFLQFPDKKICLSIDPSIKHNGATNGS